MEPRKMTSPVDCGHYVPRTLPQNGKTVVVAPGGIHSALHVLRHGERVEFPLDYVIKEGGALSLGVVVLPGTKADIQLRVDILGPRAKVELSGIVLCGGIDEVSISTDIRHVAGDSVSEQYFCALASQNSKYNYKGRIVVAPDAQKTEAYQNSRNILLSQEARIGTLPQLEIYADDVKCSHGATIGVLSEEEQFYMRSRGIPLAEARVLQMISFVSPALALAHDEKVCMDAAALVENAIRSIAQ